MSEKIIYKIKLTKAGVTLTYGDPLASNPTKREAVEREGEGEARPSFYKAMNALVDDVINVCFLDPNGWDEAEVTGVTLKHLEDEIGCVITVQNKVEGLSSPIVINTPHFLASKSLKPKLELLQEEARDYLAEKRAQISLFDSDVVQLCEEALIN